MSDVLPVGQQEGLLISRYEQKHPNAIVETIPSDMLDDTHTHTHTHTRSLTRDFYCIKCDKLGIVV